MSGVVRATDKCSGHGTFPPRASTSSSPNVFVNGLGVVRVSDTWGSHTETSKPYSSHTGVSSTGSTTVFANGKPVCRVGDSISCGSTMVNGSANVFAR